MYLDDAAEPSLLRNGKVLTRRDRDGSDAEWKGVNLEPKKMSVANARLLKGEAQPNLAKNGFELLTRPLPGDSVDLSLIHI